jgi:hypothetical protein
MVLVGDKDACQFSPATFKVFNVHDLVGIIKRWTRKCCCLNYNENEDIFELRFAKPRLTKHNMRQLKVVV